MEIKYSEIKMQLAKDFLLAFYNNHNVTLFIEINERIIDDDIEYFNKVIFMQAYKLIKTVIWFLVKKNLIPMYHLQLKYIGKYAHFGWAKVNKRLA
jgi:hypothetical protein